MDRISEDADTIGVIVGSPARNPQKKGKDLFNAAWLLYEKEIKGVAHKTCLPNYDVFDEYRYFEPGFEWKVIPFKGKNIALTICEDIWNMGDNPLYRSCPMDHLIRQHPDLMINISASPFDYDHDDDQQRSSPPECAEICLCLCTIVMPSAPKPNSSSMVAASSMTHRGIWSRNSIILKKISP